MHACTSAKLSVSRTQPVIFVLTTPPFDAVIANVTHNKTDHHLRNFSYSKHGAEIWWIRALVSQEMASWRTDDWKCADFIVPPLLLGFCARSQNKGHGACAANKKALQSIQHHASFASKDNPYLIVATDWHLHKRKVLPRQPAGGLIMGTKLPSNPDIGQAHSVIVPMVSSLSKVSPVYRIPDHRPAWGQVQPAPGFDGPDDTLRALKETAPVLPHPFHRVWRARAVRSFFVGQTEETGEHVKQSGSRTHGYEDRRKVMRTLALVDQSTLTAAGTAVIDVFATTSKPKACEDHKRPGSSTKSAQACASTSAPSSPRARCALNCTTAPLACVNCNFAQKDQYAPLIHQSQFGWHFRGDTDCSNRLYDVLMAGAVPLLVGVELCESLPFRRQVPWCEMIKIIDREGYLGDATTLDLESDVEHAAVQTAMLWRHAPSVLWQVDPQTVARRVLTEAHLQRWAVSNTKKQIDRHRGSSARNFSALVQKMCCA
uniref:Exostosin GT47 domain-containing protein n=1 Tax=Coccolithus braarudii TaxID=221442 RepID=A0A7S0L1M1_9EUKA|mmetsp:Transcript_10252/g.22262  ORF Transcript_10252/g.22262 Transcript_10252/m.22262 type:complete len:487 (+) Transcript_10252:22-1482(+)|eukprot:CAMPEP_0183348098 /NCGR_PEP_ID=MMETSP0164_2-20130417/12721_1 /TAXON_ID=221442 /ORGANISM="Coccolithus pelagicus ssp braarudi, Strain PLY182g" /LENGTH=486 /DNA_ID=CAMNT_0025519647 /DNA_START=19 /DNA_END=1479 /DNA_ORIENTATION=-